MNFAEAGSKGRSAVTVAVASASQTSRASKRYRQPVQLMFSSDQYGGVAARNAIEYVTWLSLSHSESAIPFHLASVTLSPLYPSADPILQVSSEVQG